MFNFVAEAVPGDGLKTARTSANTTLTMHETDTLKDNIRRGNPVL